MTTATALAAPLSPANDTADRRALLAANGAREAAYQAQHQWTGARWVAGRDVADVAKLVRADLKAAGIVARVTIARSTVHESLTVVVTPPAGTVIASSLRVRQDLGLVPVPVGEDPAAVQSVAARELLGRVEGMVQLYNRSWNDKDRAFYVHTRFPDGLQDAHRAELEAAIRGASL